MSYLWNTLLFFVICVWIACSNPFAPEKKTPEDTSQEPVPAAETPQLLIDNLHRAMRNRDKDLYETLLDEHFWFTEDNCRGNLVLANGKEEELEIMGGSRDSDRPGIFQIFRTFEFDFQTITRSRELGSEYPKAFDDDPDGHPDEDWEVFRGRVQMLILDENGDGFRVDQIMTYKLRLNAEGIWRMIRWIDDPLSGDCGGPASKSVALSAQGAAKRNLPNTQ